MKNCKGIHWLKPVEVCQSTRYWYLSKRLIGLNQSECYILFNSAATKPFQQLLINHLNQCKRVNFSSVEYNRKLNLYVTYPLTFYHSILYMEYSHLGLSQNEIDDNILFSETLLNAGLEFNINIILCI